MAANPVPEIDPALIDLVYAGRDWSFTFRVGTRESPSDPIDYTDLSGWTITSQWRPKTAAAQTFETLVVDMSRADEGYITLHANEVVTRAMGGPGVFDVDGKLGELDETFCKGRTSWQLDVTRLP